MSASPRHLSIDRKSTRLNSSHRTISYAVFCLKKKKTTSFSELNSQKKEKSTSLQTYSLQISEVIIFIIVALSRHHYFILLVHFHFFFFNDTATTEIYTLSLHDALPISTLRPSPLRSSPETEPGRRAWSSEEHTSELQSPYERVCRRLIEKKTVNDR